jgi:hypothetical protein
MKKITIAIVAALLVCAAYAIAGSISQAITERQLRDPKQLRPLLNDNFAEIDNRTDGTTAMDITTDDITAAGADTASLDFNYPASTNVTMATITHKSETTVANMDDGDKVRYILLNAYDSATAATDYVYMDVIADDVTTATQDGSLEIGIEVNSTATTALTLDATGATVVGEIGADSANIGGTVTYSGGAATVTNGQAVTVSAGCHVLTGTGQADNYTNTITLAAPAAAGELVYLVVATASSNLIAIADSGTVAASGGIELDGNDTALLIAVDTSTWCLVSESDN